MPFLHCFFILLLNSVSSLFLQIRALSSSGIVGVHMQCAGLFRRKHLSVNGLSVYEFGLKKTVTLVVDKLVSCYSLKKS
jgi:hypothetical protein